MFWGLNLKPNRKYSQTTKKSFHISQAALDADSTQDGGSNQIYINCENHKFLICTLHKDTCEQVMLDLNFSAGDEICFQSIGSGNVTLSGYLVEHQIDDDFLSDEEDEVSEVEAVEDDLRVKLNSKKGILKNAEKVKMPAVKNASKMKTTADNSNDDDEDDDDDDEDFMDSMVEEDEDEVSDDEEVENEDEDDDDDDVDDDGENEDEEESEEEEVEPKAKLPKMDKSYKQQNGIGKKIENAVTEKTKKQKKKEKKQNDAANQQQKAKDVAERVLSGGVKIVDIRVGSGAEAKAGKRIQVYYEGRLVSNNKVFDSLKSGAGFKFNVGRNEVIKGWDVGVVGMKVGGRRRITCPPHMGYGARGSPPSIPPNSTLVFDVELKAVN